MCVVVAVTTAVIGLDHSVLDTSLVSAEGVVRQLAWRREDRGGRGRWAAGRLGASLPVPAVPATRPPVAPAMQGPPPGRPSSRWIARWDIQRDNLLRQQPGSGQPGELAGYPVGSMSSSVWLGLLASDQWKSPGSAVA